MWRTLIPFLPQNSNPEPIEFHAWPSRAIVNNPMNAPRLTYAAVTQPRRPPKDCHEGLRRPKILDPCLRRRGLRQGRLEPRDRGRELARRVPQVRHLEAFLGHGATRAPGAILKLDTEPGLGRTCVLAVDPSTRSNGRMRLAPCWIRVLRFQIIYPLVSYHNPATDQARTPARSAGDVLEAESGAVGEGGEMPRDLYLTGGWWLRWARSRGMLRRGRWCGARRLSWLF